MLRGVKIPIKRRKQIKSVMLGLMRGLRGVNMMILPKLPRNFVDITHNKNFV